MNNLAHMLSRPGRYQEAEEMHRQTLGLEETVLGKEHPDTLASMNNVAVVLSHQDKDKQAEEMHRQVLGLRETAVGTEYPDTLTSVSPHVIMVQGYRFQRAEQKLQYADITSRIGGSSRALTSSTPIVFTRAISCRPLFCKQ